MVLKYTDIIDEKTGLCWVVSLPHEGYAERDVTQSIFDGKWYLTEKLKENTSYQMKLLTVVKKDKYNEITLGYDKACKYGVVPIMVGRKKYYANRAWLSTWQEVLAGLELLKTSTFVRLYEKQKSGKYKNITLEDITLEQYKELYLQLINYRFNQSQVYRNTLYSQLESCENIEDVKKIEVDFGDTIDEQDPEEDKLIIT